MKYGESLFDICYLLFVIITGIKMIKSSKTRVGLLLGIMTVTLGCGDAFHLIPRVLNYFIDYDFSIFLGIGKMVASITMTLFYMLLYWVYEFYFDKENNKLNACITALVFIRIVLCMLPGNDWIHNSDNLLYGIIRNIPFLILGIIMIILFFKERKDNSFKNLWLLILLSFVFYIPVVVLSSTYKIVGMLMLPKTVCYILMVIIFKKVLDKENASIKK